MAEARCHYCMRPAQNECHACGRLYCAEHGEDVCLRCLSPEAATPSPAAYRGAILALGVAAAVAVYLVISPPQSRSSQDEARPLDTPTPQIQQPTATPTQSGTPRPGTPSPTPTLTGTAPTGTGETHTVAPGESLSSIADLYGLTLDQLLAANPGLTEDTPIQIGQELNLP
jgi:LysM repeat protein